MAVHKRSYRSYAGKLTPTWSRFSIITRYALKNLFSSRLLTAYFVCCFFYPLGCAVVLYLNHNLSLLATLNIRQVFAVDADFFLSFLGVQSGFAFVLTAIVGPGLVSPDLANNALPLYLCRPFSRAEYVVGKMAILAGLLSLITWVAGLILFAIESSLAGGGWMWANLGLAWGIFIGSAIEVLVFSLLSLAISAWIKRKLAAGAALLGVFFFGAGLAQAINAVLDTKNGYLVDIGNLLTTVEGSLFGHGKPVGISPESAWIALIAACVFCVALLERKVRAYEVVAG
jgi:ABC-2 type transport system permease protein